MDTIPKTVMEIYLFTTTSGNVSVVRFGMSLVIIYFWVLSWFTEFSESHLGKTQIGETRVTERIIKLTPIHASVIYHKSKIKK